MRKSCFLKIKFFLISLSLFVFLTDIANAKPPVKIYKDWSVFQAIQDNQKICYIGSLPIKKSSDDDKRGEPFITVTVMAGTKTPEVSINSGYMFDEDKKVNIRVGMKTYDLFTYKDRAWAYNSKDDLEIISTMKAGLKMTVSGRSKEGKTSKDVYSLRGFTDAYNKMMTLCKY